MSLAAISFSRFHLPSSKHALSYVASSICMLLILLPQTESRVTLEKLNTLFFANRPGGNSFIYPSKAVETSAFDSEFKVIYTVGHKYIRAVDARDPTNLAEVAFSEEPGTNLSGVKVCGNYIIVSAPNTEMKHLGRIIIYDKITPVNTALTRVHSITVGSTPAEVAMTRDCRTIIVPLEAQAYVVQQSRELIDPEGGVGIIHFPDGIGATNPLSLDPLYTYSRLDFTKFNILTEELVNRGVRFIYRIKNNTISRDLEPEFVTLSEDEKTAYVVLQENNAIAVVNLTSIEYADIVAILPLGYKNWNASSFDPTDMDGRINLSPHPVYGMFQPDHAVHKTINGVPYLFTANEGADKHYPEIGWTETKRGKDFVRHGMITSQTADMNLVSELGNDSLLGRLEFTMDDGAFIYTGIYQELYTFGGRGFSIFRADDMRLVYDSGNEIERSHAMYLPNLFNSDTKRYMNTVEATVDLRSDNKGPECEAIIVEEFGVNKHLIFIGNERPGTISIYSIDDGNVLQPKFESVNYGGAIVAGQTWQEAYQNRTIGDIDPESLIFVPEYQSPTGEPLLIVTGAVSGTLSVYAVRDVYEPGFVEEEITTPPQRNVNEWQNEVTTSSREVVSMADRPFDSTVNFGQVEGECPMYSIQCRHNLKCVPRAFKCDGVDDCGDNSDESNCDNPVIDQIYMLCVAAVTLGAISIVISLLACCFLKKRSLSYEKYEMKSRV